jgi:hypothetical protein
MTNSLGGVSLGDPQPPRVSTAVGVMSSVGVIVNAAAAVATHLVTDMDAWLGQVSDPVLRTQLLALIDAIYELDHRASGLVTRPPTAQQQSL